MSISIPPAVQLRSEVEERLRQEMLEAQRNLESTLDKTNALLRLSTEKEVGRASETMIAARKLRRSAVRRYVVALGRFTSLVVCGKMPRERKPKTHEHGGSLQAR